MSMSGGHLAHHFDTREQQYQAGKLGMWIFLATEILLFAGLFCAYAVYRANHPEIFVYAHHYLDKNLGAVNTLVLIFSSLTMAWAVRCAQLGKQRALVALLSITLLCGFGFLGIKFVEYSHKWKHGLLWGKRFAPTGEHGAETQKAAEHVAGESASALVPAAAAAEPLVAGAPKPGEESSLIAPAASGPAGLAVMPELGEVKSVPEAPRPSNVQIFFGIYFAMTGLHGIHVIAGMTVIAWLIRRSVRGDFSSGYFTPVDLGGLYWHLVDLIWIYLFPLLYLIS